MPPPPPPANVYPCLDWVPQGIARAHPERLRLTGEELKSVIAEAKAKALQARRKLGQALLDEAIPDYNNPVGTVIQAKQKASKPKNATQDSSDSRQQQSNTTTTINRPANSTTTTTTTTTTTNKNNEHDDDEDDVIMKEYGLDDYDEEDTENTHHHRELAPDAMTRSGEFSEDDLDDEADTTTRGTGPTLAQDIAGLTYHASNDEDPYLNQDSNALHEDDDEEEAELTIKPTDNLIVAGHVSREESSIEVYVYDNEQKHLYLHHDIIQADYPCCVKWIGHARNRSRNLAAAGYMNPEIFIWDLDVVDVLEPMEILAGHTDAVIDICWNSHMKNIIASGSADKHVRIWDLDECKSLSNIRLSGKVSALEFGIYEQFLLLAGDLNRHVSILDTRTSSIINTCKLMGEVEKVRWIPADHSKFLVSDDQGYVYYYDLRNTSNGQPTVKFRAHQISVTGLEFSPKCDSMLVTASADDTIKVWDTKLAFGNSKSVGKEPVLIKEVSDLRVGSILSLRMCPDSFATIAVGGDSKCNSFKTYDLTSEKEVRERFTNQRVVS